MNPKPGMLYKRRVGKDISNRIYFIVAVFKAEYGLDEPDEWQVQIICAENAKMGYTYMSDDDSSVVWLT